MTAGIYISIPFCRQKCTYCNFASEARAVSALPEYLDALVLEITCSAEQWARAGIPRHEKVAADSLYLGGGTPGLLTGEELQRLRTAVATRFALVHDVEFTIEASPENATRERAAEWAAAGVNRVSMGVQSMVERELRAVGRRHLASSVREACENLRVAGIHNISIDLIAGLPHQTAESWSRSLEGALGLGVPHLSVYMLEVDEDSRLGGELLRAGQRYGADAVPAEEQIVDFYRSAMTALPNAGFEHYEISNFARPGFASRHNEKYWTAAPYFGFGVDAHSYDGQWRWANTDSIDHYIRNSNGGDILSGEPHQLSFREQMEERMFLGLRRRSGVAMRSVNEAGMESRLGRFVEAGWLRYNGDTIQLTDEGLLFSNEVFAGFLEAE